MPPRDPGRVPQPRKTTAKAEPGTARHAWFTVLLWVLGIPAVVLGGFTALSAFVATQASRDDGIPPEEARFLLACLIVSAVFVVPWGLLLRRRQQGLN
ncbi:MULTISPECIES: hypothetical protein [unclassified Streptomyces]|uniref:hypothetical protein n=1 Tax=unclassified Streptomyces TaxID=2593676 RepID=UPI00332BEAF6